MTVTAHAASARADLPRTARVQAALAAFLAFVLIAAGSIVGAFPAHAADAVAAGQVTGADTSGLTVAATASGLGDVTGAYVALIPQGSEATVTGQSGFAVMEFVRGIADGALAVALKAPAAALDRTLNYEVLVWQQHSNPDASNIYARSAVAISTEQWDAVFPPAAPEPEPEPEPEPQPEPEPAPAVPSVTVSKTVGLDPAGESVTVSGSGFVADAPATSGARPPLAGKFTGTYVAFGSFLDEWQPSTGAPSSARKTFDTKWAVPAESMAIIGGDKAGAIELAADGTFTTTLTLKQEDADAIAGGNWGVYTYPGGGAKYAPFETFTPITFAPAGAPAPAVTVSKTVGLNPAGETVTVSGSGFVADAPATSGARPPLAGKFTGTYVAFGSFLDEWQPSTGAPSSARKTFDTKWAVPAESMAIIGGDRAGAIELAADGTFTTTLTLKQEDADAIAGGNWGVYTYPGGGAKYAPFETFTPITFAGAEPNPEPTAPVTPPVTPPADTLQGGSLRWAISTPFASYITGTIARGSVNVANGATRAGGVFQFGQAGGSTYDADRGVGTVGYTGTVRYVGHGGLLDVALTNPELQISSPGSATLTVMHGGTRVHLANVALSAGVTTRTGNSVTIAGAPTTLAASGVSIFQGNYPAGSALAPLTVVIGAPAAAPAGITGTVVSAPAPAALRSIPAAAPTTTGITLDESARAALEGGLEVTLSASGFGAGEEDIFAVVYSSPTVLTRELTADAAGVVTWTGTLPATLADGAHTFTFQGSVARGVTFDLARTAAAAASIGTCEVTSATLSWGFLTSFRNYIEGVGGGGWELDGVEYQYPRFVWSEGEGSLDIEQDAGVVSYGGSIRFTGHEGVLDTTLTNARIELAGATGYLVFDIAGDTQSGETVDAAAVRFAEFAVPADAFDSDTGVLTLADVPTQLTAEGAAAFGSYPEGQELDPLSATIEVDPSCLAPAEVIEAVVTGAEPEATDGEGSEPAPVWPWAVGGIVLLLVIAAIWFVVARRKAAAGESAA